MPLADDENDAPCNRSSNPTLDDVLELSRRSFLGGAAAVTAVAFLGGAGDVVAQTPGLLGFEGVPASGEDQVFVPRGYGAQVLYSWGDPISGGRAWDPSPADPNTSDEQAQQAGTEHDGMHFFPLPLGSGSSSRGLLVMNHESAFEVETIPGFLSNITPEKVRRLQAAHGVSIIEVSLDGGRWSVVRPSGFARRITAFTPIRISGPAAGDPALRTAADPTGTLALGTFNNCANGYTPWGTYLTCEENFDAYFAHPGGAPPANLSRYGVGVLGANSRYSWHLTDPRFDAARSPNEPNRFGWIVEIDPFDPGSTPVKRTALGRIKHENAAHTVAPDGRVVVYTGDDQVFEYVYKFVTRDPWNPGDRAANANLLDAGTLYAARFNADGTGNWLPLVFGQGALDAAGGFQSQADVLIRTRQAADRVGATKMDRPEWVAVSPLNRDVFVSLTNNSSRGVGTNPRTDAANPRANNVYGHIIRWTEDRSDPTATGFRWSIFVLAGDPRNTDATRRGNVRGDIFGSPDGLWVDPQGRLFIQTDISSGVIGTSPDYQNIGNNQMLVADPTTGEVRRFLTGPRGCELTGIAETPDGRTLFVNIQHPGEGAANPSTWPEGPGVGKPRSSTLAIRKEDGGVIGS
jgi:secreted PhoX family phosphatase